jgi:TetR/AcrR family transcriptional regulator
MEASGGQRRGRIREEMEGRILEAAETVFAEKGFEGATMAAIAQVSGLPKANVHYYFATKERLYRAVLDRILALWLQAFDPAGGGDDPATVLAAYIRLKMRHSREHPAASRVFASEIMRGAPVIRGFLENDLKAWVLERAGLMRRWVDDGRMDEIDPTHLLFLIWAATQTYADFDTQIRAVTSRPVQTADDFEHATRQITRIVLQGCGICPAEAPMCRLVPATEAVG